MGTISVSLPSDGDTADVSDYNGPINTIVDELNGNLDNANLASNAAIDGSKLADNSIDLEDKVSVTTGWTKVTETWTYSAYDSTYKTGTITVPSDATTKYSAGMKVKFDQTTDGTKYGIITNVASTSLKVYMGTDYDFDSETISNVFYSSHRTPFGFPISPAKWTVSLSSANDRTINSTAYVSSGDTLSLPIGTWRVILKAPLRLNTTAASTYRFFATLSSDGSTETNPNLTFALGQTSPSTSSTTSEATLRAEDIISTTTTKTLTLMGKCSSTSSSTMTIVGSSATPISIRAEAVF